MFFHVYFPFVHLPFCLVQPGSTNLSPWQRRADRLKSLNSTDRLRPARFIAQQVQVNNVSRITLYAY